jgi:hypothetical protein
MESVTAAGEGMPPRLRVRDQSSRTFSYIKFFSALLGVLCVSAVP